MLELVANGSGTQQRLAQSLKPEQTYILGRDRSTDISVPWDSRISRRHVRLTAHADELEVERLAEAANPLFVHGEQTERTRIPVGGHFVVGETMFQVIRSEAPTTISGRQPAREYTFDQEQLQKVRYQDADKRINVLANIPEVIWGARTETELFDRVSKLLLAGISTSEAVAIVEVPDEGSPRLRHWERRHEAHGEFRPSNRLATDAVRNKQRTVLQVWDADSMGSEKYTAVAEFDWAFCTPVKVSSGNALGLYITGKLGLPFLNGRGPAADGSYLQADVKFTELVAEIIAAVRRVNVLERERAGFRQFFAPTVLSALEDNPELLEPRETDVTALFCDLRGFSRKAEEAGEDLIGLLNRVSTALEIMTEHIHEYGGVTADFLGDAALGFWGWPIASPEAPLDACRAALGIRAAFDKIRTDKGHPLANFSMGIGIAHGRAVAGKIGTRDQVKVTVFGPVVNLASRLESMTKQLRVPIVMDEITAQMVREHMDPSVGRVRKLATIMPYGMERPVRVSELVPPLSASPDLTDELLALYDHGVECFEKGEWEEAHRCFHKMPESDRAQDFPAIRIAQHNRIAPPDWDGIVRLASK